MQKCLLLKYYLIVFNYTSHRLSSFVNRVNGYINPIILHIYAIPLLLRLHKMRTTRGAKRFREAIIRHTINEIVEKVHVALFVSPCK